MTNTLNQKIKIIQSSSVFANLLQPGAKKINMTIVESSTCLEHLQMLEK